MPEWLIGALCSAPIWMVVGMFMCSLCVVSSWADEQNISQEEQNDDNEW